MDTLTSTTTQSGPFFSYTIRCSQRGRSAIFFPQRQQISLIEGTSKYQVELGFSPSRLLELMVRNADVVVTRNEILEYAWPERVVTQSSLNQAISRLRELLGDEQNKEIIQTIPRRGYVFNSSFLTAAVELSETGDDCGDTPTVIENNTHLHSKWDALPEHWQRPVRLFLVTITALMLSTLLWRVDWDLLLQPNLVIDTQQENNQRLIYTAPNLSSLESLQNDLSKIRERLVLFSSRPGTLVFNRTQDYYDITCIHQGVTKFITVYRTQLATVNDQQLRECLQ
ncbi:transcriptional regulator [Pseudomonas sp. GL-B-19]|uniref:winged helix-turn-helix domain-containing protein n=1 Tax=Pseudomonas sp. GL-B-19 TaxID=2832393 RepID=UPI001CC1B6EE|nr:winged helix-turn-helix domain-containing protein [Pseudomonas sp. GL-B-19]